MPNHKHFLELAEVISSWSKDPSSKVGAIIADSKKRIVGLGYNGFPRGVKDDGRLHERNLKYDIIIHAEVNAILNAVKNVEGCVLYTTHFPCPRCAGVIIQSGISKVFYCPQPDYDSRWEESIKLTIQLFSEAGVEYQCL
jgi:Deoxycytidylate deaminase